MKKKAGIVIQARMGSTRLPGKVLMPLLGKSVLENVVENARSICPDFPVIVATSTQSQDDPIFLLCEKKDIPCYRGDENNVCLRYLETCEKYHLDYCCRICADSPFVDFLESRKMLSESISQNIDFSYNSFKQNIPYGMGAHVFKVKSLINAYKKGFSNSEKEHVTLHFLNKSSDYKILEHVSRFSLQEKKIRVVLDYEEDYVLFSEITRKFQNALPESEKLIEWLINSGNNQINLMHPYEY